MNECCFKGSSMGLKVHTHSKTTPWYLGKFWIFSGSNFATPLCIGHRGVALPRYKGHWGVATPQGPKQRGSRFLFV